MRLTEISTVTCQQMLMDLYENGRERYTDRKGNGLSVKTVKDIKIALQTCLQKAVDEQIISANPCKKVQLPREAPKEMQTLKSDELSAFLNEARDSGWYEFYYLELTTGLRLGEITALTWDDLDVKNKTISVNKQVQRINGEIVLTRPKTDASIRKVSLCDECLNQLLILRSKYKDNVPITCNRWIQRSECDNKTIAFNPTQSRCTTNQVSRPATQLCNTIVRARY